MRHPQASKSTRSSRSKASPLFLLAIAAGCAAPEEVSVTPETPPVVAKLTEISFERFDPFDDFALVMGDRSLYLGTDKATALEVFEPLEKAITFNSVPPQFGEEFKAFGWEADNFGFGGLTYTKTDPATLRKHDLVVQAMYTQNEVDDEAVSKIVQTYTELYGAPSVALPGSRVAYWFWSKPGRRLMVNTAVDSTGDKSLTVAVGETQVMTLLGMEANQAKTDKDRAIQRLNAQGDPQ